MWKFWTILGALILAGLAYAYVASRPAYRTKVTYDMPPTGDVTSGSSAITTPAAPLATEPANIAPVPPTPTLPSTAIAETTETEGKPTPVVEVAPAAPSDGNDAAATAPPTATPTPYDALVPNPDAPVESVAPVAVAPPEAKPDTIALDPTKPLAKFGEFEVLPATIVKNADGSMLVDGKHTIKGEGTAAKPYIIQWDLLTSVEEAFDPSIGKRRLPERVTMLDGKYVRVSGYVAFPMTSTEPRELLSMLNQWDGCCIGTPPTPYDAVEVALKDTVVGDDRFATTGRVMGTFHVKPFLQGDWLIGLYVMEDATLTPREFGGAAAN